MISIKTLLSKCDFSKDYYFRVRNKKQASLTVVNFVFSKGIKKDRRCYTPARYCYLKYKDYCRKQGFEPLSARKFKENMQLLGFVYKMEHHFYPAFKGKEVTTAYKNIEINN